MLLAAFDFVDFVAFEGEHDVVDRQYLLALVLEVVFVLGVEGSDYVL